MFKIVDLESDNESLSDKDNEDYMYFLAKIRGKHLVDPFSNNDDLLIGSDSDSNNPYEKDS